MSEKLDRARRYHGAIHEVLMRYWDPIGVENIPEAQDEYDAYIAGIYGRLVRHVPRGELLDYLWSIETEHMGLSGDRQRTEAVVGRLLKIRDEMEIAE
jgi:hypothetical protein